MAITMDIEQKLLILGESAKYDVSCASSGSYRKTPDGGFGSGSISGICHSWSSDGRCVSLLKILLTNICIYDCEYCLNRASNNIPRTVFKPEEIADLTINFYKRNYIEGLFLSSGIIRSPDYTMDLMYQTIFLLRNKHRFGGYIHAKIIPGSSDTAIEKIIPLADRVSSNIELPSHKSLEILAPDKSKSDVLYPIQYVRKIGGDLPVKSGRTGISMSTQLIVGASPETDKDILTLAGYFYKKSYLKRVYYSAYIPVNNTKNLPSLSSPPLMREHRLYQADWLMRFYNFSTDEIVDEAHPFLMEDLDPKTAWALRNLHFFPVDVNLADKEMLLRVPGIGVRGVQKILSARKYGYLTPEILKKIGISLKRAKFFISFKGKYFGKCCFREDEIYRKLTFKKPVVQTSIFDLLEHQESVILGEV